MRYCDVYNLVKVKRVKTGRKTDWGTDIYEDQETLIPYKCSFQPYVESISSPTAVGRITDVTNMIFCPPNEQLNSGVKIVHKDKEYEVLYPPRDWGRHYEVYVKYIGKYQPTK
ncbi:hypothetical protein ABE060_03310 [Bacillus rugosus]|uniref:hypothetical protein n=1 Tax=Bacillus rugosus TaxID=2715209 RepID=UPI00141FC62F|nr:hypothetical protein [Bacillus rugosus]NUF06649.1 hypothetical protein [Bacillus rugosus]